MASSSDAATFWLISVPNSAASSGAIDHDVSAQKMEEDRRLTRRHLEMKTQQYSKAFSFNVPKLKV
jgi:hypothetical protein